MGEIVLKCCGIKKRFILPELGTVESGNGTASSRTAVHFCLHSVATETADSGSLPSRPCPKIPQLGATHSFTSHPHSIGVNNWNFKIRGKFTPSIKDNVYFPHPGVYVKSLAGFCPDFKKKIKPLIHFVKDAALTL